VSDYPRSIVSGVMVSFHCVNSRVFNLIFLRHYSCNKYYIYYDIGYFVSIFCMVCVET
jgi:hypothetical protein